MVTSGAAARSTLSASATTSGPMPSPPMTASLIVREPMPEPYWRGGPAGGGLAVPPASAAWPPLSRRSSAICTALIAPGRVSGDAPVSGCRPSGLALSQGYMSYTSGLLIGTPERDLRPAPHPQRVAGLPWIRSLQVPAAAGYKYEVPHSACYVTRLPLAADGPQDVCLSIRDSIFKS